MKKNICVCWEFEIWEVEKIKVWNWCYSTWVDGKDEINASQFVSSQWYWGELLSDGGIFLSFIILSNYLFIFYDDNSSFG
jgi:hypothetical protein